MRRFRVPRRFDIVKCLRFVVDGFRELVGAAAGDGLLVGARVGFRSVGPVDRGVW